MMALDDGNSYVSSHGSMHQFDESFKRLVHRTMKGSLPLSQPIAIDFGRRHSLQLNDIYAREAALFEAECYNPLDKNYDDDDDEEVFHLEL
ncbi:hypothetical protein SPRG_09934 [Saprolegnia parasitica CBS 223.65]|uniref:Uncharacterized protein n=1 Tax=Saprolegnia parasitica (strain CBS 223.65) TaxID=695850 RepID=A0A067CBW1_SAPPC|nr:hypothetical protein SPRG_09934 [Saprolegnia parasitica CBS 223.65]KDO24297.1 hypothetical protein SPRG_09934 [Saprolegnia parasitica CBS 223.65]|eukprot:XP_012205067.1 hypothetical protein SPRG_09934 [Saprolegnia parasitica CBS 223.65]